MVENLNAFLEILVGHLWGLPMVVLLIGGGIFFSFYLGGIQIFGFKHALDVVRGKFDNPNDPGELTHFKALCAALSGTVGLGNIAGVAVAIKLGGPGATFWMILAGVAGMATKYAEVTLSLKYRKVDEKGVVHGGPMYVLSEGLKEHAPKLYSLVGNSLAYFFAFCCILASIGAANMFQANQVAMSMQKSFGTDPSLVGATLALLTFAVIVGGIKRIGNVAGMLVPVMGITYVVACSVVIFMNLSHLPAVVIEILSDAFTGTAAVGGFTGAALRTVIIQGVRRAVFSCEAGMGSAAIAHSAAKTKEPASEGSVALLEPFIDTVVICTMTALVVNITGVWQGEYTGVAMTQAAFNSVIPGFGVYFIPVAVGLFAFSTMVSWSYYGERATEYLFGQGSIITYKVIFCLCAFLGSIWAIDPILNFSDSCAALMVIPNMLSLFILAKVLKKTTKDYFSKVQNRQL